MLGSYGLTPSGLGRTCSPGPSKDLATLGVGKNLDPTAPAAPAITPFSAGKRS